MRQALSLARAGHLRGLTKVRPRHSIVPNVSIRPIRPISVVPAPQSHAARIFTRLYLRYLITASVRERTWSFS
jgi:hypothetical protein